MNWKHLFWIIPLSMILGGYLIFICVQGFINITAWGLTESIMLDYAECKNISIDPSQYGFTDEEHKEALSLFCKCPKLNNLELIK